MTIIPVLPVLTTFTFLLATCFALSALITMPFTYAFQAIQDGLYPEPEGVAGCGV